MLLFAGYMLGGILVLSFITSAPVQAQSESLLKFISAAILGLIIIFVPYLLARKYLQSARNQLAAERFAEENGLAYVPEIALGENPGRAGTIFDTGDSPTRKLRGVVSGVHSGLKFEFGNFTSGIKDKPGHSRIFSFGVVDITLSRRVPHIMLVPKTGLLHNQPHLKFPGRELQLEGNFNSYFNLYVPEGYERDALYFITPELMELFITHNANYAVELIDGHMFIYTAPDFRFDKAETLRTIFGIIDIVGKEVEENTSRYSDARVGDRQANVVAEGGKKIRRSMPWWLTALFILFFLGAFILGIYSKV